MSNEKILNKKLLKNINTVVFFDMVSKVLSFLLMILLVRLLSKESFAAITLFISISALISNSISNGLNLSYVRYEVERYSKTGSYTNLLIISLLIQLMLIIIVVFLFYIYLCLPYSKNVLILEVFFFSVLYSIGLVLFSTISTFLQIQEKYVLNGTLINIKNLTIFFICFIFSIYNNSINFDIVAIIYILAPAFSIPILYYIFKTTIFEKINKSDFKEFIRASIWLILYSVFIAFLSQVDIIIINSMLSERDLANYGVSFRYYIILLSILPSITTVLRIRTSKKDLINSAKKQKKMVIEWIRSTSKYVIPLITICIIISPTVLPLLNGDEYQLAIIPFQILSIGAGISYIFSPGITIFMAMKKYRLLCGITLLALSINVIGNILIINHLNIIGVAIMTILAHAFLNITIVLYVLMNLSKK